MHASLFLYISENQKTSFNMHGFYCEFLTGYVQIKYKLDAESKGSTRYRHPKARGCGVPSALSEGATSGLRVSKERRSHWTRCLTDLIDYSNRCRDIHSVVNKTEKKRKYDCYSVDKLFLQH